jgi:hypothetical protein
VVKHLCDLLADTAKNASLQELKDLLDVGDGKKYAALDLVPAPSHDELKLAASQMKDSVSLWTTAGGGPIDQVLAGDDNPERAVHLVVNDSEETDVVTRLTSTFAFRGDKPPNSVWNALRDPSAAVFRGTGASPIFDAGYVGKDVDRADDAGGFTTQHALRFGARFLERAPRGRSAEEENAEEGARAKRARGLREARLRGAGGARGAAFPAREVLDASPTLAARWKGLARETSLLARAAKLAFLCAPVNGLSLKAIIRADDVFPFGFLLFRPYMTYLMGSGILTTAGKGTGETLIGHADFQLADNVVQKMHIGNFTMYLKSIVYQQQNVYIADHIFAQGYLWGDNVAFWNAAQSRNAAGLMDQQVNGGAGVPSIFACLVPYDGARSGGDYFAAELPNPLDVTGAYSPSNPALESLGNSRELHYASAQFYAQLHSWNNSAPSEYQQFGSYNRYNTLCFQGHQAMFNVATRNYDLVQLNTGHWGPRVYQGCGKVRKGLQKALEPVSYNSVHGESSNRSVTLGY